MLENLFTRDRKRAAAPPGRRLYAVGDIHGCRAALDALTAAIEADAAAAEPELPAASSAGGPSDDMEPPRATFPPAREPRRPLWMGERQREVTA